MANVSNRRAFSPHAQTELVSLIIWNMFTATHSKPICFDALLCDPHLAQVALPPSDPHQLPLEQLELQQPVHQAQLKLQEQEHEQPRWQPPPARALQWATGVEFGRKRVCAVDVLNEENEACGDIVVQPPAQVRAVCEWGDGGQMRGWRRQSK